MDDRWEGRRQGGTMGGRGEEEWKERKVGGNIYLFFSAICLSLVLLDTVRLQLVV